MVKKDRIEFLKEKFLNKYRIVVLNEETFEERFALKLTRLIVLILAVLSGIVVVALTTILIAFTPIREYIPGYSSTALKKKALKLSIKIDSLEREIVVKNNYFNSIKTVLTGHFDSVVKTPSEDKNIDFKESDFIASSSDSLLRQKVDNIDRFNTTESETEVRDFVLFPPLKGIVSETYNITERHYAIDIAVATNTPVKSIADGMVVFSEWTIETGYVIIVMHNNQLTSVYKHNSQLNKSQGDIVKSGEVIALAGGTGEYSTGPHLHFELWSNGIPVNPLNFIDFE